MITSAAAEIAQHFQGLGHRLYVSRQRKAQTPLFADTLLWVSQREAVREVSRLLRCLGRAPLATRAASPTSERFFPSTSPAQPPGDADD